MQDKRRLFDLFGDFTANWPIRLIQPDVGIVGPGSSPSDPASWLGNLNNSARLSNVRVGATREARRDTSGGTDTITFVDRSSVEAQVNLEGAIQFPFVFASMPDVEFRVQNFSGEPFIRMFASVSDLGAEVVLEGLPVEILLPIGLVEPYPDVLEDVTQGETFKPGQFDSLEIIYRRTEPTSIFVHIRLSKNEADEFTIRPSVPITFGKCLFLGLPCLAVHGFELIPSPSIAQKEFEWVRHSLEPLVSTSIQKFDALVGQFAVRSIHFNDKAEPIRGLAEWISGREASVPDTSIPPPIQPLKFPDPVPEFVLDDLVVPFFSPYVIPIPRHITVGFRRKLIDPHNPEEIFSFKRAPVHLSIHYGPVTAFIIESLFYKSLPSATLGKDLGIQFVVAVLFGEGKASSKAIELEFAEDYTIRVSYRRDFISSKEPAANDESLNRLLHWNIANSISLDIMRITVGLSITRFTETKASTSSALSAFKNAAEVTVDIFVSSSPTESRIIKFRSLNGEKTAFVIEGFGWRQGSLHLLEGISLPDGVMIIFGEVFILLIQEYGLVAEDGASYLSFTGGLGFRIPDGLQYTALFIRLRFRVSGNEGASFFKFDGAFLQIGFPNGVAEEGGYYTEKKVELPSEAGEPVREALIKEFAFTGRVKFRQGDDQFDIALDFILGKFITDVDSFFYWVFFLFVHTSIPNGAVEYRSLTLLLAWNTQPALDNVAIESQELRYYNWYKQINPLVVPGDRRLSGFRPADGTITVGIGFGISLAKLGKLTEISAFLLGVIGSDERGFLIAGEVRLLKAPEPLGFLAIEWDGKNSRFDILVSVNIKASTFSDDVPEWFNNFGNITGTLFISNDPGTFAIGRLADQRSWASVIFKRKILSFDSTVLFGVCIELVEGNTGPKGFGLVVRMDGGFKGGPLSITANAGFGVLGEVFHSGSSDYAAAIRIELGARITAFRFLRFGFNVKIDFLVVGMRPSRGQMSIKFRLETPWYLPDITWRASIEFGEVVPEQMSTAVRPLRIAAATDIATKKSLPVHIERFFIDPNEMTQDDPTVSPTYSINQFGKAPEPQQDRLLRFDQDQAAKPIATDSEISIDFSVAVNDLLLLNTTATTEEQLGTSPTVAEKLGDQRSGDLTLRYDLVGLTVRRHPRHDVFAGWELVDERAAFQPDFSSPDGVVITGFLIPLKFNAFWSHDVQIEGRIATKKLVLNSLTPFEFKTADPLADAKLLDMQADWPCCTPKTDQAVNGLLHEIIFRNEQPGASIDEPRLFTRSQSRLTFLRPAYARPHQFGNALPSGSTVAFVKSQSPGPFFRAEFDEDVAICFLRLAWRQTEKAMLILLAFGEAGNVVGSSEFPLDADSDFREITLAGQAPIKRLEARLAHPKPESNMLRNFCLNFRGLQEQEGPNPRTDQISAVGANRMPVVFLAQDNAGTPVTKTEIRVIKGFTGLDCKRRMVISLPSPTNSVTLTLVHFGEDTFLMALNAQGQGVTSVRVGLLPGNEIGDIPVTLTGEGITTIIVRNAFNDTLLRELCASYVSKSTPQDVPPVQIEVDRIAYVGLRDRLDTLRDKQLCSSNSEAIKRLYEGQNKVFFLPNYEYEIEIKTRIAVEHPTKQPPPADVTEYIYFKTKGLPGLNAVSRIGEELEPYVLSIYKGGKGVLYRDEPVVLVFKESLSVAVPLAERAPGLTQEHNTLLRMKLLVEPDSPLNLETTFTATDEDWLTTHRGINPDFTSLWKSVLSQSFSFTTKAISDDSYRIRLAALTQRNGSNCILGDPREVVRPGLIAVPQGSGVPSVQMWQASVGFTASVKLEDAGFVDRRGFQSGDETAFIFALSNAADPERVWSVVDGELHVNAGDLTRFAIFGESTWDHQTIRLSIKRADAIAGIGVSLPDGDVPFNGLFAFVEGGPNGRLVIYRRRGGIIFEKIAESKLSGSAAADDPFVLVVTTFDDKLRATVGDIELEVDREQLRAGRVCLAAQGAVEFSSLQVSGLNLYTFPFSVSRFQSFDDHISSFNGTVDFMPSGALGAVASTTVASLWASTKARIEAAMQPSDDLQSRELIFNHWMNELGLPIKDDVIRLEISSLGSQSDTELLLLESPEPLDFTEEITMSLFRREITISSLPNPVMNATALVTPPEPDETHIDIRVIQNSSGTKAIILPVSSDNTIKLGSGNYRLIFEIEKQRWTSTDMAERPYNTYKRKASSLFRL